MHNLRNGHNEEGENRGGVLCLSLTVNEGRTKGGRDTDERTGDSNLLSAHLSPMSAIGRPGGETLKG